VHRHEIVICPGCGLELPGRDLEPAEQFNASGECLHMFYNLTCWTRVQGDQKFIHQHAVDAYAAQHSGEKMRPITTWFALIGLFLALERGYSGRRVQQAHTKIGKRKREWPRLSPPKHPGDLTVMNVISARDAGRDEMLMRWAASVWKSWAQAHQQVKELTDLLLYGDD
jgi:hypothetical protein